MCRSWKADKHTGRGQGNKVGSIKANFADVHWIFDTNPIPTKRRSKVKLSISHAVSQICGVSEVRIGPLTPKVLQWDAVDGRVGRTAQLAAQYSPHIRPCRWGATRGMTESDERGLEWRHRWSAELRYNNAQGGMTGVLNLFCLYWEEIKNRWNICFGHSRAKRKIRCLLSSADGWLI